MGHPGTGHNSRGQGWQPAPAMDTELNFLTSLFSGNAQSARGFEVSLRLLRRAGRPFLLLPSEPREAITTLALYAPQTTRAQVARAVLRWPIRFSSPWPGQTINFELLLDSPFVRFLSSLPGVAASEPPRFGILAGNPASPGQRFLLLCFNAEHQPVAVVKVALTRRGHDLIQHEQSLLSAIAGRRFKGVPAIIERFHSGEISAFAMHFFPGNSPRNFPQEQLPSLLNSWVDNRRTVLLSEMPNWLELQQACAVRPAFQALAQRIATQQVHPCLEHGDLTPWNIKISPEGICTVLDWERGELTGIPGWDWFHHVIQTAILVKRQPTSALAKQAEALLAADRFKSYAARCRFAGFERELLLSYLLHVVEVIKPSEGRIETGELLTTLARRWQIGIA